MHRDSANFRPKRFNECVTSSENFQSSFLLPRIKQINQPTFQLISKQGLSDTQNIKVTVWMVI